jgi:hypothetical protein
VDKGQARTHVYTRMQLLSVDRPIVFDSKAIPGELYNIFDVPQATNKYMPIFYLDELAFMQKNLVLVSSNKWTDL